jgi:hypothetical protein
MPGATRLPAPTLTAIAPAFNIAHERAKLLDPAMDNPPQHIMLAKDSIEGWHWEAVNGSERGRYTIEVLCLKARDWPPSGRFFQDAITALEQALGAGAANADVLWREIEADFLDPLTPYRDRLWWYLNHWYNTLPPGHQTLLGGMHPFPNAHLAPQPPTPRIADWWPIPVGAEPAQHLQDWLDSVDRHVQIMERRARLVTLCTQAPRTVAELEDETGARTVRADIDQLVEGGRLTRLPTKRGRAFVYSAVTP